MSIIPGKAAVVGIGQTPFGKGLGRTEYDMGLEAILAACEDAGISPSEIDGLVRFDMESLDEEMLLSALGNPDLSYFIGTPMGGGGSASVLVHAALGIASGMAETIVCYRSRARGKNSSFGKAQNQGGRYWERLAADLPDVSGMWHVPQGLVTAFQEMAMITRRHQIEYGTTEDHFGEVAVTFREHAIRNPNAVMRMEMTLEDHHQSRMISDPLRLFDCNIETDGACAMIVTTAERARDLRQPPAIIRAGSLGAGSHHRRLSTLFDRSREEDSAARTGKRLFAQADLSPDDIDCAYFYDFFTSLVIIALEDYGFCPRGEGGPFVADGGISWDRGRLPCNTNGGQLSEAFIHGFNNNLEAVRQIRGTSTSQVEDCRFALVAGANTDPTGAFILERAS
ncbi:lipid-transfer protein [Myxococcota bacterium]|nr:lipid-transfer protein [Myxococcota bacterium]